MIENDSIFSVTEISNALKVIVERTYGFVRVRGELSEVKRAASGHVYMTLKDAGAVLNAIVWKTAAAKLQVKPEDGLEVIVTGRMTTYPGRSNYQIVIDQIEVAGEGALLKLIEERRKKLTAEGLFDADRKRPLPLYPKRIGVITSPTGAVIRDILHRLADRYPCEVWLWPVLVQGEGAAQQITQALSGVTRMHEKPDIIIVARGGGSIEDLMPFNDEAVVRAAAACPVPLISAVGHETDTTLIDFAADRRAPTPTAAAELATPQRSALLGGLRQTGGRLSTALLRRHEYAQQKTDQIAFRLDGVIKTIMHHGRLRLQSLNPRAPQAILALHRQTLAVQTDRMVRAMDRFFVRQNDTLMGLARMLKTVSFEATLERGFVLVRDTRGAPVTAPERLVSDQDIKLQFAGGKIRTGRITD